MLLRGKSIRASVAYESVDARRKQIIHLARYLSRLSLALIVTYRARFSTIHKSVPHVGAANTRDTLTTYVGTSSLIAGDIIDLRAVCPIIIVINANFRLSVRASGFVPRAINGQSIPSFLSAHFFLSPLLSLPFSR